MTATATRSRANSRRKPEPEPEPEVIDTVEPGRIPVLEAELTNKYNVGWTFRPNVSTSEFDIEKGLKNQARFVAIDEDIVASYQEAAERGDKFPAVLAYRPRKNGRLVSIDGNHRLVSHERAGKPVDVYEVDHGTKGQTIALMTYALNTRHGKPTNDVERTSHALYLVENGASVPVAAELVNVAEKFVRKAVAAKKAAARAVTVGLDPREWEALPGSAQNRLLNVSTDEGFKDAAHLAFIAGLTTDEVFDLVQLLGGTQSATKQRSIVKQARDTMYTDRIQASASGKLNSAAKRPATPKSRIGMAVGQVLALPEADIDRIVQAYAESEKSGAAKTILNASEVLRKIALALDSAVK